MPIRYQAIIFTNGGQVVRRQHVKEPVLTGLNLWLGINGFSSLRLLGGGISHVEKKM